MKAMVLTGINQIEIIEKKMPEITKPGDVLLKMMSVGICGSDIHYYREGRIGSQVVQYPFTIGHEGAGIVTKIGESVFNVNVGDRVAIDPAIPCYSCAQCKIGRFHTCLNLKFLGCPGQSDGCLSEFIVMPSKSCYRLYNELSFDQGALSEPLAIGVYATHFLFPLQGKKIGILGSGPIGISVLLAALAYGVDKIYMTDKIDARLAIALEMGASWIGNPDRTDVVKTVLDIEPLQLDIVFECCGSQEAMDQGIKLLKPGGKLLIVGIPPFDRWSFDVDYLRRNEISIQNIRRQNESVEITLKMIADGRLIPDKMQTHDFKFEQIKEAFELAANYRDGVMKAMIHF